MNLIIKETIISNDLTYLEEFDALRIDMQPPESKYPAQQHARSVAKHLGVKEGLIYLVGQPEVTLEDSDQPTPFRQRRYFYYLSGVDFADCIVTYDIGDDDLRLFIPLVNKSSVIWLGPTPSLKECEEKYNVDSVDYTSNTSRYVMNWVCQKQEKATVYVLHKNQTPQILRIFNTKKILNSTLLLPAMDATRVVKSDFEIRLIRRAVDISSAAHRRVLAGLAEMDNETQVEALFVATCIAKGAKNQAYGVIAGSGENASTLHYVANNQPLDYRQLVCLDASCEWACYASDITRTFPISGTFSKEAKEIYDIVEEMQETCISKVKPGVLFLDLHRLAMQIAVKGLMKLGILHNGTFEEILPTGVAFFPHGLGHHLGLECHDVSFTQRLLATPTMHDLQRQNALLPQSTLDSSSTSANISRPYDGRQTLVPNMVITVEPGIYFSRYAFTQVYLRDPRHAKHINAPLLEKYYPIGGVRIEDDILVTEAGFENLTSAPKGEEMCRIIRGER